MKVATLGSGGTYAATAGKTYTAYAVTGPTTGDGIGSTSFTVATPVVTPAAPAAPALNATYNTAVNSVTISWAAVSGATSYDYQVGSGAVQSTTGTSVTLNGLAAGNTAFKLRATNTGGSSAYTAATVVYTVPVVTPAAPAAPALNADLQHRGQQRHDLVGGVSGATSYDYQVGSGAVQSTTGTSVSLNGLAAGNTAFKLRATNAGGSSAYTAATVVYTVPVVTPAAPAAPVLSSTYNTTNGSVTISWAGVTGATGYDYQVGSGAVQSTTGTSVTLNGLAAGETAIPGPRHQQRRREHLHQVDRRQHAAGRGTRSHRPDRQAPPRRRAQARQGTDGHADRQAHRRHLHRQGRAQGHASPSPTCRSAPTA